MELEKKTNNALCVYQVGQLWKGQPAGEENNDTPLHAASRAGNKVEWRHFLFTKEQEYRYVLTQWWKS